MSLKEYQGKRNFRKTPEPAGDGPSAAPGRKFVIQKHAARRLHYDFRLELEGTLKSWAVPKGPSLDPAVKALAVQVEDHPLEYASFEGVIPQGEYGGGTVMVWDRGTWEPEGDAAKGLKNGRLKLQLHGEKLRGGWSLVRMGGRAGEGGKNWLLIKQSDQAAMSADKADVLKQKPRSVLSNREMKEIAADADRVWSSDGPPASKERRGAAAQGRKAKAKQVSRKPVRASEIARLGGARKAPQPRRFKPQLATLAADVPEGDQWLHELKFDGYRILAFVEEGAVRLVTRNGNDWTGRFSVVARAVESLGIKQAILDGEVVSVDASGLSDFQQLQNLLKRGTQTSLVYYVFDLPHLEGYDLTGVPLAERKELLARVILAKSPGNDGKVRYSDHIAGQGPSVLDQACRSAIEGVISKRADSVYRQARTASWLKVKCLKRQEFVIGGYTKPSGARIGFGALLVGYYQDGKLIYAGRVGTGFTNVSLRQLTAELKKRRTDAPPFAKGPVGRQRSGVTWVRPELVGEVEFAEWTEDGLLRHPSFQGLREDKPPESIGREDELKPTEAQRLAEEDEAPAATQTARTRKADARMKRQAVGKKNEASVAGTRLTNPDRVLYPKQGLTKLGLAEFFEQIADWVLPYVVGRPLTLVRCPEGRTGECFYQKHRTGHLPEAVRGVMVEEKGKRREYVRIDDLAGLISLVQVGVLEIHPWPARVDKLERPDYLVFDLDPGEGVEWKAVVQGAKDVRRRLSDAGLASFLRTTGGKGLHVVVPLTRRNTWDEVKEFAKAVADELVHTAPDRYIATMSKARRRGKVFVDYLRNQRGATAIASYSTRARPGAPVATPLAWDELTAKMRPDRFTVANLPQRLDRLGTDPWKDFFTLRQSITAKARAALR